MRPLAQARCLASARQVSVTPAVTATVLRAMRPVRALPRPCRRTGKRRTHRTDAALPRTSPRRLRHQPQVVEEGGRQGPVDVAADSEPDAHRLRQRRERLGSYQRPRTLRFCFVVRADDVTCAHEPQESTFEERLATAVEEDLAQKSDSRPAWRESARPGRRLRNYFICFAARRAISSGAMSSLCVAIHHLFPTGSVTPAFRSP